MQHNTSILKVTVSISGNSPPSSTKVTNAWSYTATQPYVFMTWYLVKYRIHLHGVVLS